MAGCAENSTGSTLSLMAAATVNINGRLLARAGANVVVSDVVEESGAATVQEIKAGAGTGIFVKADLSAEHEVSALVDRAVAAYGRLDGAFNNAGLEQCALPLHELTTAQWERALRVNPGVAETHSNLALALHRSGQPGRRV